MIWKRTCYELVGAVCCCVCVCVCVCVCAGADPGFGERGGLINIFTTGGRVREGACHLP